MKRKIYIRTIPAKPTKPTKPVKRAPSKLAKVEVYKRSILLSYIHTAAKREVYNRMKNSPKGNLIAWLKRHNRIDDFLYCYRVK